MSSILKVKQVIFVLCLCFAISANAVPQAERDIVIGYGSHVLSLGFDTCMQKELRGKTFAQQELECLKQEFQEVKRVMDTTYQDIITLMEKKKWKERRKRSRNHFFQSIF